jgi:hypothetical protein
MIVGDFMNLIDSKIIGFCNWINSQWIDRFTMNKLRIRQKQFGIINLRCHVSKPRINRVVHVDLASERFFFAR